MQNVLKRKNSYIDEKNFAKYIYLGLFATTHKDLCALNHLQTPSGLVEGYFFKSYVLDHS